MKATFEKKENYKVFFNIELDSDKFGEAIEQAYLKNRGKFNIPGFRKGKVPKMIIERYYGEEIFYDDAINIMLPEAYDNAIKELELDPVDYPEIDIEEIEKGKPIVVKVQVDVKPEVELGDYKSIELEKIEYNVTDELVENELKSVQESNARILDGGDREVKEGDLLTIDFAGFVDGEQFPGGTASNQVLEIGSGRFIPGFEEQLVGKNKGEEVVVNVKFPEEYHEESLAGKDSEFKVTIHEIKEKELPVLDDEFAKDVSEFDTLEEYKADIKAKLEEDFRNRETIEKENKVIEKVVEDSKVDIPNGMIESQLENEVREFEYRLRAQGLELEQYLNIIGSGMDQLKEQLKPTATRRVKADLVLESIAKAENIEVKDEDIDAELEKMAAEYNQEDKDKFIDNMKKGNLDFLKTSISNTKVIELLMSNAKFN